MDANELCYLSAGQLGRLIQKKEVSPVEVIEAHIKRTESLEPRLNSFIAFLPEKAREEARRAEKEILAGRYQGTSPRHPSRTEGSLLRQGNSKHRRDKVIQRFHSGL